MSGTVNKVFIVGRLGRDPEQAHAGQDSFARFSVATDDKLSPTTLRCIHAMGGGDVVC